MNKYIFILIVFILGACKQAPKHKVIYSILIDATDSHITRPNPKEVFDYLNIKSLDTQVYLRIREIAAVDDAKVHPLHFKPEQGLLSNQVEQKRNIRSFEKNLNLLLGKKDSVVKSPYSNIFNPLCDELLYLSKLKGMDTKHILIFSDLKENNSEWMSFYNKQTKRQLLNRSSWIINQFSNQVPELNSTNVKITVIHIPKNQQDNIQYKAIKHIYKKVFTEKGIDIEFVGNLNAPLSP